MPTGTSRGEVLHLWRGMKEERDLYLPTWRQIAQYVLPQAGRFMLGDTKRGQPSQDLILNAIASESLETGAAGMASSLTNPARQWFRLTTATPRLAEVGSVRAYLFQVERLVAWVLNRSNVHGVLVTLYRNAMGFGTAPIWVDEDETDVMRGYTLPVGQYVLASSHQQRIDTVGREFEMTVRQLARRFGEGNPLFSAQTKRLIERREWNQRVPMIHVVCPNDDLDAAALDGRQMPWTSSWLEATGEDDAPLLLQRGYRQFPCMVARWEVNGTEDVYGVGPMHRVLPDVKQLQHTEEKKLDLLDKLVAPPLNHPAGAMGDFPSIMAGALNPIPDNATQKTEPTYIPDVRAYELAAGQCREISQRIREGLNEDLWRLMTQRAGEDRPPGMTATEVSVRHEEKLVLLGPVVDRFHNEVLSPLIRRIISILSERHVLPRPPRELVEAIVAGEDVRIEYLSVLAQAQRLLGLGSLERFASIVTTLARFDPTVLDKVDRDEVVDQAADMLGIPPNIVRSDDEVIDMRVARARRQQQADQMAQMQAAAQNARALGQTPASGDTALSRLLTTYGPAAQGAYPAGPPGAA